MADVSEIVISQNSRVTAAVNGSYRKTEPAGKVNSVSAKDQPAKGKKDSYEPAIQQNKQSGESNYNNALRKNPVANVKDKQDKIEKPKIGKTEELTPREKREVRRLKAMDRQVRAHENAHRAAGGGLVRGGTSFDYTVGPDGKRYASSGEVKIDISPISGDPEATIEKMKRVRRAALAPADPSPQDRAVASRASAIQSRARAEMLKERFHDGLEKAVDKNKLDETYGKNKELEKYSGHHVNYISATNIVESLDDINGKNDKTEFNASSGQNVKTLSY